jgi:hypothetical protein
MQTQILDGAGVDRTLAALHIIDGGGVDRVIQRLSVIGPDGQDRLIYSTAPALSVSVSPAIVVGSGFGTGIITTDVCIATPVGGTGPYTYAWTLISYTGAPPPTALSPASATSRFRQTGVGPGQDESAVFRVTVTDSTLATAVADVTAIFTDTA